MAGSEEIWRAVVDFCEKVMLQKETPERIRHQEAALKAPAGAAAAVATATRRRRGRRRRRKAGGAPIPLLPSGPTCSKEPEGWRYARGGPHPPHRGMRLRGRYTITWGLLPLEPSPSIPLAQVPTHEMARSWDKSLSSRRHIGIGRSEGAEAPSGPDKKDGARNRGEKIPPSLNSTWPLIWLQCDSLRTLSLWAGPIVTNVKSSRKVGGRCGPSAHSKEGGEGNRPSREGDPVVKPKIAGS